MGELEIGRQNAVGIFKVALTLLGDEEENMWYKTARMMARAIENGRLPDPIPKGKPPVEFRNPKEVKRVIEDNKYNPYDQFTTGGNQNTTWLAYEHLKSCLNCHLKYHTSKRNTFIRKRIKEDRMAGRI